MTENPSHENDFGEELHEFGKNLSDFLRTAWASEERKKFQKDLESTISGLGVSIDQAAENFSKSDTGKQMKEDLQDLKEGFKTGETQEKARREVLEALKKMNEELTKAKEKWNSASSSSTSQPNDAAQSTNEGDAKK